MGESFVGGLAAPVAVVNLLENHGEFRDPEGFVPRQRRNIAAGLPGVFGDEFIARVPAGTGRDGFEARAGDERAAPVAERQADVAERIADGGHFPIKHSFDAIGRVFVEHDVVELEIVVDQRRCAGRGNGFRKPCHDAIHFGARLGAGAIPSISPAVDLALDESFGFAERSEAVLFDIDRMHLDYAVDECPADARGAIFVARDFGRNAGAENDAPAALHQKEWRADDVRVFADQVDFGRGREVRMNGLQDLRFAHHIVSFGGNGTERGSAENVFAARDDKVVGEVGVAAGELFDLDAALDAVNFSLEIFGERG